jgi:hypothetical protein
MRPTRDFRAPPCPCCKETGWVCEAHPVLAHDTRVVGDVRGVRYAVDQGSDIRGTAAILELTGAPQGFIEGDEIDRFAALAQVAKFRNTLACASRKKSPARTSPVAMLKASLSMRIAPSTDRSASRE